MVGVPARARFDRSELLALSLAALNVVVLLAGIGALVSALYLNSDVASAPVIGALAGHAPRSAVVTLGDFAWYEPLWFLEVTRSFPAHRLLWEAAPFVGSAVTLGLVVWSSLRALGRRAAVATGVVLACTTPATRTVLFTPNEHGMTALHCAALAATLVYLTRRRAWVSTRALVVLAVVLSLFTAAGESDRLLLVGGIVPFAAAACVVWWRTRHRVQRRIAIFAVATAALAVVEGEIAQWAMRHAHVVPTPYFNVVFVPVGKLVSNLELLVESFANLGGGNFFGRQIHAGAFAFGAGVLTLLAAAIVLRRGWRAAPGLPARVERVTPARAAHDVYAVFWGLAIVCTIAAYVLTNVPGGIGSSRYLFVAYIGIAALLPAVAGTSRVGRAALATGVSLFALVALHGALTEGRYVFGTRLTSAEIGRFEQFTQANRLTYGYADYSTAAVLSWRTGLRAEVFPVAPCGNTLCPYYLHTISSWYRPRRDTRTFLVVDAATTSSYLPVSGPTRGSGRPVATARFGDLTVYVYDHDIANAFGSVPSELGLTAAP